MPVKFTRQGTNLERSITVQLQECGTSPWEVFTNEEHFLWWLIRMFLFQLHPHPQNISIGDGFISISSLKKSAI